MDLLAKFMFQIDENKLCSPEDRILVSCSGGRDSMVLAYLLREAGYSIGLMYIDHLSREGESFSDSLHVAKVASMWEIPYYYRKFHYYSQNQNSNFQDQARKFRYQVLQEKLSQENYTVIATGHHQQDSVESFFLNLSKKSGLEGLLGIEMKQNNIVRPLLHLTTEEIDEYCQNKGIQHIIDQSNYQNNYNRNEFRNTVVPKLLKWDENFVESTHKSIEYLKEANQWIEKEVEIWTLNHVKKKRDMLSIPLDLVKRHHCPKLLLHRILKNRGFNISQVNEILSAQNSGQIWIGDQVQLNLFQSTLYLYQKTELSGSRQIPYPFENISHTDLEKILIYQAQPKEFHGEIVGIPLSKQNSKLMFRNWLAGDYMKFPYGKKKLKKVFLEHKIPKIERSRLWVLAYETEVFWIEGIRNNPNRSSQELFFIELLK